MPLTCSLCPTWPVHERRCEHEIRLPKLIVRVRFPSPAPDLLSPLIHRSGAIYRYARSCLVGCMITGRELATCPIGQQYASRRTPLARAGPSCPGLRRAAVPVPHGHEDKSSRRESRSGPSGSSARRVMRPPRRRAYCRYASGHGRAGGRPQGRNGLGRRGDE